MLGRPVAPERRPVAPFRIHHAELHPEAGAIPGKQLVEPGGNHDGAEIDLHHQQRETLKVGCVPRRELEEEHRRAQPERDEAWRAHAAKHAPPAHADEQVMAQQQVDARRQDDELPEHQAQRRRDPYRQQPRADVGVLHRVDPCARPRVATPPLALEVPACLRQGRGQRQQQQRAVRAAHEGLQPGAERRKQKRVVAEQEHEGDVARRL